MIKKDFDRLITLHNIGVDIDPKIVELNDFITYHFTNLISFSDNFANVITYGKSIDNICAFFSITTGTYNIEHNILTKLIVYYQLSETSIGIDVTKVALSINNGWLHFGKIREWKKSEMG